MAQVSRPLLALAASALILLVLTAGIPAHTKFLALLNNAGHAPIFGLLALIVLRLVVSRRAGAFAPLPLDFLIALEITVAMGAAVEWAQFLIGRGASVVDILMDAAGATAALATTAAYRFRRSPGRYRAGLTGLTAAAVAIVLAPLVEAALAYQRRASNFPVLARFERPLDLYFIRAGGVEFQRAPIPEPWAAGRQCTALRVRLVRHDTPGFHLEEPAPDWRGYERLELDLVNSGPRSLQLMVRVHDRAHDQRHADRFNLAFTLAAESRRVVSIPLHDIEQAPDQRAMDLEQIAGMVIFERSRPAPAGAVFYLCEVRLR